jgi:hypothetical protein
MISRLVAARAALLKRDPSVVETLKTEFSSSTMAEIGRALAQAEMALGSAWEKPFEPSTFFHLLASTPEGRDLEKRLAQQNELFASYLEKLVQDKKRLILCDTGLYGSTLQMLEGGFPQWNWEQLFFARSNYRALDRSHFNRTIGLMLEADIYDPFKSETAILRFWHLFEFLFEPALESVKTFEATPGGGVRSNLEIDDWRRVMETSRSLLLEGAFDYLRALPEKGWLARVLEDEPRAWARLKRVLLFPRPSEVKLLAIRDRGADFGRNEIIKAVETGAPRDIRGKMALLRSTVWKEGTLAAEFPVTRLGFQAALEAAFTARALVRRLARRS